MDNNFMKEITKAVDALEQSVYSWMEKHEKLIFCVCLLTLMFAIGWLLTI